MSEERSALGIGRFGVILGCLRASLEVLAKHFIKRFGRVLLNLFGTIERVFGCMCEHFRGIVRRFRGGCIGAMSY